MARGAKTSSNDGMGLLALAPFPAWNPWNWWALTSPRNAVLATLTNTRLALDAWRASSDGWRAMLRLQQDEALKLLQTAAPGEEAAGAEGAPAAGEQTAAAALVQPVIEATRAYGRVGRAFIVAQRDTLRALGAASRPN